MRAGITRQKYRNPYAYAESADPSATPDTGYTYTNDVGGRTELMYMDDTGAEIQLTSAGALNGGALPPPFVSVSSTVGAVRNGTNPCTLAVYNTSSSADANYERAEYSWTANTAVLNITKAGTGTQRGWALQVAGVTALAMSSGGLMTMGVATSTSTSSFAASTIQSSFTGVSGTRQTVLVSGTYSDGGTNSTAVIYAAQIAPTVNYTAGSKTGKVYLAYFSPTLTAQPTGQNAGLVFSSTLNSTTFPALVFNNQADEDTNFEKTILAYQSNNFVINTTKGGTGTARSIAFQSAGVNKLLLTSTRAFMVSGYVLAWDNADSFGSAPLSAVNTIQNGCPGLTWTVNGTLTGSPTDFNLWTMTPTLAGAFTVTRLNYFNINNVAGAATVTDAAVFRFDAAVGTHKATAANAAVAVTITSVGPTGAQTTIQGWMKINVNGTLRYVPFW